MDLEILEIASNTDNNKILEKHTHSSKLKNSMCGDEMSVTLNVKNLMILDFGYQCKSCVYCQASASLLAKLSKKEKLSQIKELILISLNFFEKDSKKFPKKWSVLSKIFNKKNFSRKECIQLPFRTLSKALRNIYE